MLNTKNTGNRQHSKKTGFYRVKMVSPSRWQYIAVVMMVYRHRDETLSSWRGKYILAKRRLFFPPLITF